MKFIVIIIVIIILIYISCYFIFPPEIQIMQTTINDFNFSILYTRQPIVIYDCVKEKEELINSWFKYNSISSLNFNDDNNDNNDWIYNKYKYLFISANEVTEVTEIIIYKASIYSNPPTETDSIIAIKLQKDQSLILPYRWKFFTENKNNISVWGINDLITSFVSLVF